MLTANAPRKVLLVLALLLVVTACGDDDGSESSSASGSGSGSGSGSAAEAEGEESAGDFCDSLQAFNAAVLDTDLEEATEEEAITAHGELEPLWSAVRASAPDEVGDDIETLSATIDALGEGDAEPFNDEETAGIYFGVVADVVEDCVDEVTDVTAVDYAFEGVPETLPAGSTGIRLVNDSDSEKHEFIIFKKSEGETRSAAEILNDPASREQGPGEFAGAVFAAPGSTAGGFLDLEPGDYMAVCFVPVGGGEEGPPHFTQGMVAEFRVA